MLRKYDMKRSRVCEERNPVLCTQSVVLRSATPNPFAGHDLEALGDTGQLFADGVLSKHQENCAAQ